MNRRHNLSDIRLIKEERKAIKKGLKDYIPSEKVKKKTLQLTKVLTAPLKHHKKTCKRDSTGESIENSPPSYPHKEGGRWISTLRAQQSDKTIRFAKKAAKHKG